MANRDVGISICGVVVGVLLGAGSVLYAQDAMLSASSMDVTYRDAPNASEYKARNVERNAKKSFRDNLKNVRRPTKRGENEPAHTAAPVETEEGTSKPVDNNCKRFAGTSQQAKCEGSQAKGQVFRGR